MKNSMKMFLFTSFLSIFGTVHAQTVCDSLSVDTVIIENNTFQITVYNSSQTFIAYPFFTIDLDENTYIDFIDSLSVPTFLSVPSDAGNGFTSGYYSSVTIANASTVPSNTIFTGHLIIQDPNDSTFYCSLPFSFTYGNQVAGIDYFESEAVDLYTNPTNETFTNPSNGSFTIATKEQILLTIVDPTGRNILHERKIHQTTTFNLEKDGLYTIILKSSTGISHTKIMVVH